jgi:hypothetical protein
LKIGHGRRPGSHQSERDLIKKISGGKLDEAIDHSSDFELFNNRRTLSLLNKLDSRSGSDEFAQVEKEVVKHIIDWRNRSIRLGVRRSLITN